MHIAKDSMQGINKSYKNLVEHEIFLFNFINSQIPVDHPVQYLSMPSTYTTIIVIRSIRKQTHCYRLTCRETNTVQTLHISPFFFSQDKLCTSGKCTYDLPRYIFFNSPSVRVPAIIYQPVYYDKCQRQSSRHSKKYGKKPCQRFIFLFFIFWSYFSLI